MNTENAQKVSRPSPEAELKRLSELAQLPALLVSWVGGIAHAIAFVIGILLSAHLIGRRFAIKPFVGFVLIVIGVIGMAVNYFVYKRLLERGRNRYSDRIAALEKELKDR